MGNIIKRYLDLDYAEVLILVVGIYLCYIGILRYKERKQGEAVPRIRYCVHSIFAGTDVVKSWDGFRIQVRT